MVVVVVIESFKKCFILSLFFITYIVIIINCSGTAAAAAAATVTDDYANGKSYSNQVKSIMDQNHHQVKRRATTIYKYKPGFFWTLGSSIFQTYNETKSAVNQIGKLVNDQFVDEKRPPKVQQTMRTETNETTTTEAPYKLTRKEFQRIILRNLRGLIRLYNLELDDALKQSTKTREEFNKQLRLSIKKELS